MLKHPVRNYASIVAIALISASCAFSELEEDLERMDVATHTFTGEVSTDGLANNSIVVIALRDPLGNDVANINLMYGAGPFEMRLSPAPTYFFGYNDLNKDLKFQRDEPYGWASNGQAIEIVDESSAAANINIAADGGDQAPLPEKLVDKAIDQLLSTFLSFSFGDISSLDNPWFSEEQSEKGLWQPFAFMEDGGTGIHFIEPYDPDRIPVLFVHGITGSPRNFATLIERLDRSRYQAWVYSYPSGLKLDWIANGMVSFMELLHSKYQFNELHVVAHSMGGLVSRGGVNKCVQKDTCSYLRTYTSISTPWNGVESARSGVKWAPTVVPVWRDLDPSSDYVTTLFDTPLPSQLPYHLIFGFRQDGLFGSESGDGVIKLTSQLREAAQNQAVLVHGYDENHVSILSNDLVIQQVYDILASNSQDAQ